MFTLTIIIGYLYNLSSSFLPFHFASHILNNCQSFHSQTDPWPHNYFIHTMPITRLSSSSGFLSIRHLNTLLWPTLSQGYSLLTLNNILSLSTNSLDDSSLCRSLLLRGFASQGVVDYGFNYVLSLNICSITLHQ